MSEMDRLKKEMICSSGNLMNATNKVIRTCPERCGKKNVFGNGVHIFETNV